MNEFVKKYAPKPSDSIKAMTEGLDMFGSNPQFVLNFDTYTSKGPSGYVNGGCLATLAIMVLTGEKISRHTSMVSYLRAIDFEMMGSFFEFRSAIDSARLGDMEEISWMYQTELPEMNPSGSRRTEFNMTNDNWERLLPRLRSYAHNLIVQGL
jgi:hypothetical protein